MRGVFWLMATMLPGLAAEASLQVIDEKVRSAGCYIAAERGVVMTIGRFKGHLQLPGGSRERGESPACTARRETLEETGLLVQVAEPVGVRNRGRFVLFRCLPEQPLEADADFSPLDLFEVREVLVVNPLTLHSASGTRIDTAWRFPDDRELLATLFKRGEPAAPEIRAGLDCAGEQS